MGLPVSPTDAVLSDGHVVLATGSTSGIGRGVARNLAAVGATVLVHGRDRDRARRTVEALPGDGHDWYLADFADLDAVRDLAAAVQNDYGRLDCLVNNAGTWQDDRHLVDVPGTHHGVELTFVVNHLAHFLLTHELVDRLAATADRRAEELGVDDDADPEATTDLTDHRARVVTVSSALHRRREMDLAAVRGPEGPSDVDAYAISKLANVMFTYEFARRSPDGITATCCHPGTAPATRLARDGSLVAGLGWRLYGLVGRVVGTTDSPADAAETPTYLACSPDVTGVDGEYFEDCERVRSSEASYDRTAQQRLWDASATWVGLDERDGGTWNDR